jgi:transposase
MLARVAPIPASCGQLVRVRLNRGGNRQLNRAFHTVATVQAAHHPPAREYVARKLAEQKSGKKAIRALKRQLVRTVFRLLREGAAGLTIADRHPEVVTIRPAAQRDDYFEMHDRKSTCLLRDRRSATSLPASADSGNRLGMHGRRVLSTPGRLTAE